MRLRFKDFPALVATLRKLGAINCLEVLKYRVLKKSGYYSWVAPIGTANIVAFAEEQSAARLVDDRIDLPSLMKRANEIHSGIFQLYFHHKVKCKSPPNWYLDPLAGHQIAGHNLHWSKISFFPAPGFDIKNVWELSRFYWLTDLSKHYRSARDPFVLTHINALLASWQSSNPPNQGPNWMCGQETSLRLLNFLLACLILNDWTETSAAISDFISSHLNRIELTLDYALAQCNNHAISEAAALFLGGVALSKLTTSTEGQLAPRALRTGQAQLERLASSLIEADGSFSQRSTNYHRLMLDALSLCVWAEERFKLPPFSAEFRQRYEAAYNWLFHMVDTGSGLAPNLGGNDGSLLFQLSSCDYSDFRPTLQFAAALLNKPQPFEPGPWDEVGAWLNVAKPNAQTAPATVSRTFPDGGYVVMRPSNSSWGMFHVPKFKFRPAHSDLLHLDLWHNGKAILRDSGTLSYNPGRDCSYSLDSTPAHNTISFDGQNQMPKLSRFLYADWLDCKIVSPLELINGRWSITAQYSDKHNRTHARTISTTGREWIVTDKVSGSFHQACLWWHLAPEQWKLSSNIAKSPIAEIKIASAGAELKFELVESPCSRYYQQLERHPCLRCTFGEPTEITTHILLG